MTFQELGNNDFAPFKGDSPVAAKMILEGGVEALHRIVGVGQLRFWVTIECPQPFHVGLEASPGAAQPLMLVPLFSVRILAFLLKICLPSALPLRKRTHKGFLVCVAHLFGDFKEFLSGLGLRVRRELYLHVLHGMELAMLEIELFKGGSQSFKAIAHDAENGFSESSYMLDAFFIIRDPFLSLYEFMPKNTTGNVILDYDHAKITTPICGVHQQHDLFVFGILDESRRIHFLLFEPPPKCCSRDAHRLGDFIHCKTSRLDFGHDFSCWSLLLFEGEARVASLANPSLDSLKLAVSKYVAATAFWALFLFILSKNDTKLRILDDYNDFIHKNET